MRRRVKKRDALVDHVAGAIEKTGEGRVAWLQRRTRQDGAHDRREIGAGQPHNADAAAARRGGNGDDGIAVRVHARKT
jgi:hypothetical protein